MKEMCRFGKGRGAAVILLHILSPTTSCPLIHSTLALSSSLLFHRYPKCVCAQSLSCDPMGYSLPGSSVHGIFQARILEWVCHLLLQGIFPTQGSIPYLLCFLHWQVYSLPLCHLVMLQECYTFRHFALDHSSTWIVLS